MTWTAEHRATYGREGPGFPSNLTDAEWAVLAPLIPQASPGGRPPKTDMRQAMNAIFYLLRTGSPWRYLPRDGFPPRSTVYNIFRKFQADGTWEAIWAELYTLLREREGREASPTAAVMDSQTIKSAERMARPVRKGFVSAGLSSLHKRIRPSRRGGWPRWRSARPGPHKGAGVERHFPPRLAGHRSTVRPSSSHHPQTSWAGEALAGRSGQAAAGAAS